MDNESRIGLAIVDGIRCRRTWPFTRPTVWSIVLFIIDADTHSYTYDGTFQALSPTKVVDMARVLHAAHVQLLYSNIRWSGLELACFKQYGVVCDTYGTASSRANLRDTTAVYACIKAAGFAPATAMA